MTVSNEPRAQSAAIYRFLSRIFRREPDAAAVAALRGVRFPEAFARGLSPAAQKWLTAGARFNRAVSELASDAQETLDEKRAEYLLKSLLLIMEMLSK